MIKVDEHLLIRLAGPRNFSLGMQLFEEGQVCDFETTERTTRATVLGRQSQQVHLRHTQSRIEGDCQCEVSGGIDFCHHCVAVALCLQEKLSKRKPLTKRQAMSAIRRHLSELSHEALLDELMEILNHDRSFRDDWLQEVLFASGAPSYADLKKMIATIGPPGEPQDFRQVRTFFEKFESLLARINTFVSQLDPIVLLRTVEHAVHRLNDGVRDVDAYYDYWDGCTDLLVNLHLNAISRLDWPAPELAAYLVDRFLGGDWHPIAWGTDLYVSEFGNPFGVAMINEVESRLAAVAEHAPSGADEIEYVRTSLEDLKENLEASFAANG